MVVRVLQFTDTHLFSSPDGKIKGVNSYHSLKEVLKMAFKNHSEVDFVVLTGDLSQDESKESYQHLAELISPYHEQVYYIPGNHDDKARMQETFACFKSIKPGQKLVMGNWCFLFLDSALEGKVEGSLSEAELDRLRSALDQNGAEHVAIFLHHNPVTMDGRRPDPMMLTNADQFFSCLDERVEAIICGHVHQGLVQNLDGIRHLATPSTCVQFIPTATGLTIDQQPPGYRYLEFSNAGKLETEVFRLDQVPDGLYRIEGDL